jgi:hypothetical protein
MRMSASENGKRPSYIPPHSRRKDFPRKIKEIEKKKLNLRSQGKWKEASRLGFVLRNAWWGYKRYPFKT